MYEALVQRLLPGLCMVIIRIAGISIQQVCRPENS
jgi:hypothetical protein